MAYTNVISRTEAQALVPEVVSNDILQALPNESAAMSLFRQVRMATNQTRMPVISALPIAYFVNGDTGLKQTTEENWTNKYLNVEEIAAIIPIPEAVLDDVAFDIWGEIRPKMEEAIARTLDAAVFFGTGKPASWPSDIVTAAVAAGNTATRGTNNAAAGGIAGDISDLMGTVEADGFEVNGMAAVRTYRGRLRQARSTQGERLMEIDLANNTLDGIAIRYPMRGLWPTGAAAAELVAGDFSQGILGIRQDITYKFLDQAVIQDNAGNILFNLAQQDMIAMRVVFRCAFQVANFLTWEQGVEANRYPFAVLRAP